MSKKVLLSSTATLLQGALMVKLQPMLAMDAKLDLSKPLAGVTAKNIGDRKEAIATGVMKLLNGKLKPKYAQDGSIKQGLDEVLSMIEGAKKPPAEDEDLNEEEEDNETDGETAEDEMEDEDADMAGDEDEEEEGEKKKPPFAKDKKAKDKKPAAMDAEKEEEDKKAMDAAINAGIEAGMKKERQRTEAINAAKEVVRPRVGNLSMAFDSAAGVYTKAFEMLGKKPPKSADADALKFAFENLPAPQSGQTVTFAQDSARTGAGGDVDKVRAGLGKMLDRIGSA